MSEHIIENEKWECEEPKDQEDKIVCKSKTEGNVPASTVKLRGDYAGASMKLKTDRGEDVVASSHLGSINFNANRVGDISSIGENQIRGRLD